MTQLIWIDEAGSITPRQMRAVGRSHRKASALQGWANWYISRGRIYGSGAMFRKTMRQCSWRRAK